MQFIILTTRVRILKVNFHVSGERATKKSRIFLAHWKNDPDKMYSLPIPVWKLW